MELEVYKKNGSPSGEKISLSPEVFEIEPHQHAMYEAVKSFLANQRQGTNKTKTRGEVAGSGKKLWKQKHTGRARMGSARSPLWKGGGTIFGPQPRDYRFDLPKKIKRLARKSALSYMAKNSSIKIIEDFTFEEPKTRQMADVLKALNIDGKKTLLLTQSADNNILRAGRNIPSLQILEARKASTYEILKCEIVLFQQSAIAAIEQSFGGSEQ
ncbi:MAG: 50S ribosomal protein L4 [Ignavibacteria bacterium]|nr:50S ribosomal protein L4 [Ignavibacteria bacterium]